LRRVILALTCFIAIQPKVFAQGTWGGLTFGASLEETRNYLAMRGVDLEKRDPSWNIRQGWDFTPAGSMVLLHFTPRLYFSPSDRLERIVLNLNDGDGDLARIAAASVREQLIGRYGAPATETPGCAGVDLGPSQAKPAQIDCRAIWRAEQQVVTLNWTYGAQNSRRLVFQIDYVVLQNGF
jgi:hypothetical protein